MARSSARLLFVLFNLQRLDGVLDAFRFWNGGMVAYGGFLGGFVASAAFCRIHRIRLLAWADCAVPSLALGLVITRVGCFLGGCDFGEPWNGPWAVRFPAGSPAFSQQVLAGLLPAGAAQSLPVHPTQLYESFAGLLPDRYSVTIPKEQFVIYEATIVNGTPENGFKVPRDDVTGTINLATGIASFHVVIATLVHFQGGCTPIGCIVNDDGAGLLTADISGTMVPPDSDGDGISDLADNCRFVSNPTQTLVPTPTIVAPADLTLASCADHRIGVAKAADVCDAGPVTVTNDAPGTFARGANLVTWKAVDGKSREATDTQTVTVVDTTAPTFTSVPPDLAVYDCGPVNLGTAVATDDGAGTPAITNNAPSYFYVGMTVVTWTATDLSGNSTVASQTVTVTDTVAPTVFCVTDQPLGNAFRVSATDACTTTPTIRLGGFVLANGEQIKINETGQPGVRLVNVAAGIRHFQVGRGEAIITATDPSNNVATAICR